MSRYSDMNFYMNLDSKRGVPIILEAIKSNKRKELHDLYAQLYPNMDKDNFISFEAFVDKNTEKAKVNNTVAVKETKEEIMDKVSNIMKNYKVVGGEQH